MKLHAEDPLRFEHRSELAAVFAGGCRCRSPRRGSVRMGKIKIGVGGNIAEKLAIAEVAQLVPAHVWQFHVFRQLLDVPVQQVEAFQFRRFGAVLIESLQAEANAQKWCASGNGGEQWVTQTVRVKSTEQRRR